MSFRGMQSRTLDIIQVIYKNTKMSGINGICLFRSYTMVDVCLTAIGQFHVYRDHHNKFILKFWSTGIDIKEPNIKCFILYIKIIKKIMLRMFKSAFEARSMKWDHTDFHVIFLYNIYCYELSQEPLVQMMSLVHVCHGFF